jgi:ubiquitin-conjugating enzyme E2 D/E
MSRLIITAWKTLNDKDPSNPLYPLLQYIQVTLKNNNLYSWLVCINSLPGSPFEGGSFLLSVEFPQDFPHRGPSMKFLTSIYHPNVDSDGSFSLEYNSSQPLANYFINLLFFISTPNPDLAINPEAASLYVHDVKAFEQVARHYTERDANDFQRFTTQNRILNPHHINCFEPVSSSSRKRSLGVSSSCMGKENSPIVKKRSRLSTQSTPRKRNANPDWAAPSSGTLKKFASRLNNSSNSPVARDVGTIYPSDSDLIGIYQALCDNSHNYRR